MAEPEATAEILSDLQGLPIPVILVADDEVLVRNLVANLMRREGYVVMTCANGIEGLDLSRQYPGKIDMLLTDDRMPHLDGAEFALRLRVERPGIKVLVMSGADVQVILEHNLGLPFLPKPFNCRDLKRRVREMLAE